MAHTLPPPVSHAQLEATRNAITSVVETRVVKAIAELRTLLTDPDAQAAAVAALAAEKEDAARTQAEQMPQWNAQKRASVQMDLGPAMPEMPSRGLALQAGTLGSAMPVPEPPSQHGEAGLGPRMV